MSPAGKSEGSDGSAQADETSVMMRPVNGEPSQDDAEGGTDTERSARTEEHAEGADPQGAENGSKRGAQVVQADDLEESAEVPPWQRLTSEVRQPEAESPYAPVATGQLPTDDGYESYESTSDYYPGDYSGGRANEHVLYADQEQTATNLQPVPAAPAHSYLHEQPQQTSSHTQRSSLDLGAATASARQQPSSATPTALRRPGRGPRRASLQVKRVDPWSVLKLALVLSIALFFVWLVAVGVLYGVLDGMGVWDKLNGTYSDLVSSGGGAGGEDPLISAGRVFGIAAIVGGINIILFTALSTVAAFIYNVSADLAGGLELTLAERE